MTNRNPSLPQDILIEIFSRLPSKSVGKCKCLSKSWFSILSSHQFISLHLSFNLCQTNNHQKLILITPSHALHLVTPTIDNNDSVSRKIDLPGFWTQVIGSCKGLVLLTNKNDELYLVNPIISRMVRIPDFDLSVKSSKSTVITHGLGYDTCTDDYKIVTLSFNYIWDSTSYRMNTFANVYSVKKGVWKRIDDSPFLRFICVPTYEQERGVYASGAIHWLVSGKRSSYFSIVATFDLVSEVFYDTGCPDFLNMLTKSLVVRGGRLCAVSSFYGGGDVWTMEERGSVESWKKFTRLNADEDWSKVKLLSFVGEEEAVLATNEEYFSEEYWKRYDIPKIEDWPYLKPVCFIGEEGVVLRAKDGRLFVHDMKEGGTIKAFVVDGVHACCMDMGIGQW